MNPQVIQKIKNYIEIFAFFAIILVVFLSYGPISHIAALRGINTAPLLTMPIDWKIPYQPFWILFYCLTLAMPTIVLVSLIIKFGNNQIPIFLRTSYTIFLMTLFCYCIFIALPCSVIDMFHIPQQIWLKTTLDDLVRLQFVGEAPFNDNPSLHVATGWILYRYISLYFSKFVRNLFLIWLAGMIIGTLTLKVHVIENDVAAIIIAELFYRYIFLKQSIKFANFWLKIKYSKRILAYALIIVSTVAFHYWFIHKMGILTDISAKHNLYAKMLL